jgi:hypothetical protein
VQKRKRSWKLSLAVVTLAGVAAKLSAVDCTWSINSPTSTNPVPITCWVSIGTSDPKAMLHVGVGADPPSLGYTAIYASNLGSTAIIARDSSNDVEMSVATSTLGSSFVGLFGTRTPHDLWLQSNEQNYVVVKTDGKVGIGTGTTSSPQAALHVGPGTDQPALTGAQGTMIYASNNGSTYITARDSSSDIDVAFGAASGAGGIIGTRSSHDLYFQTAGSNGMILKVGGLVNIGNYLTPQIGDKLVVNGAIRATSVIGAVYQDLAEWVPASEAMPPGTVVVVDDRSRNTVRPSSQPYDTRVAGVVSAQPGLLLGIESPSKEMIATTGRVKVRVDASNAPIHMGDLLVTSDKPGVAMLSQGIDLGGVKIHRPGTLIGKALEPLESGEGEILVLLSLQ